MIKGSICFLFLLVVSGCTYQETIKETQIIEQKETAIIDLPGYVESTSTCSAWEDRENIKFNTTLIFESFLDKEYVSRGERLIIIPFFRVIRYTNKSNGEFAPPYEQIFDRETIRCYWGSIRYNTTISGKTFQDTFSLSWEECERYSDCGFLDEIASRLG